MSNNLKINALVNPLVSIIIDTYYRPAMLREAVVALCAQTYTNIEIIIVNNGATPETISYLMELEKEEHRVKLVHFKTNQFSWDDPLMMIRVCYNAGLRASKGELVFYQSDDDWVASDFIERMVRLFADNPHCITAIGRPISAMPDGTQIPIPPARRDRYIPGHELALDFTTGFKKIAQFNPGHCFVMRREALMRSGGFHETFEFQQMFAIIPFGITGYDPDALMYWRRHELQLNLIAHRKYADWSQYFEMLLNDPQMKVLERWQSQFGIDNSVTVEKYLLDLMLTYKMQLIFSYFFHLQLTKAFILTKRLRKIDSKKRLSMKIIRDSFKFSAIHTTRFGKNIFHFQDLFSSFFSGLVADPVLTLKKVKNKALWRHR